MPSKEGEQGYKPCGCYSVGQVRTNGGLDNSDSWMDGDSTREGDSFLSLLIGRCPPCSNRHIMKALADVSENVC